MNFLWWHFLYLHFHVNYFVISYLLLPKMISFLVSSKKMSLLRGLSFSLNNFRASVRPFTVSSTVKSEQSSKYRYYDFFTIHENGSLVLTPPPPQIIFNLIKIFLNAGPSTCGILSLRWRAHPSYSWTFKLASTIHFLVHTRQYD